MVSKEAPQPREEIQRMHDVDGISFGIFETYIDGFGWQGRGFKFPKDTQVIKNFLKQLPQSGTKEPNDLKVEVTNDANREKILFDVHQDGAWINAVDDTKRFGASLATDDIPSLTHVISELEGLIKGDDPHGNHFCEDYGVEDDD